MTLDLSQRDAIKLDLLTDIELDVDDLAGVTPGLNAAIDALLQEQGLSPEGHQRCLALYKDNLQRLAAIKADRKRFPEIAEVAIKRPIFILGLPRCGTSMLHALMGADPAVNSPLMWEVAAPSPPPETDSYHNDPRIKAFDDYVDEAFSGQWEGVRNAHPIGARIPQECGMILETAFCGINPTMLFRLPDFYQWYKTADTRYGYQIHKQWLQHLQWRNPRQQWVLKVQEHMYHLPELLATYPDAIFIQPHRDPRTVMASISQLIQVIRSVSFSHQDRLQLGQEMLNLWHDGQVKMMEFRKQNPSLEVHDIRFKDLVADPISAVQDIYARCDLNFTPAAERAMRDWLQQNPAGKHRYQLEDFGLSVEQIEQVYGDYIETYKAFI